MRSGHLDILWKAIQYRSYDIIDYLLLNLDNNVKTKFNLEIKDKLIKLYYEHDDNPKYFNTILDNSSYYKMLYMSMIN